jgi:plasmid stability protein
MAQLLIRKLDDRVKTNLQRRARSNGRSMEAEAREILQSTLCEEKAPKRKLGSEMMALFSGQGIGLKKGEEIREWRGYPIRPLKFDE